MKSVMKKKPIADPIIAPEILDIAKKSVNSERSSTAKACVVCGGSTTPLTGPQGGEEEDLCWVCRRLKISAWREMAEQQASAQE